MCHSPSLPTNHDSHVHAELTNLRVTELEISFLKKNCTYLPDTYLSYLRTLVLNPDKQVQLTFHAERDTSRDSDTGSIELHVKGLWVETILYEIPLLELISETYFRFVDQDWTHDGQRELARQKGRELLKAGCTFSEFGSRRRRDYKTQELVIEGLIEASEQGELEKWTGKLTGTSNVHFAMRFGLAPIGTVAHEWFMGVAAITDDYENANELGLRKWVDVFGEGVYFPHFLLMVFFANGVILGPFDRAYRHIRYTIFPKSVQADSPVRGRLDCVRQNVCKNLRRRATRLG
jgi:nicotinate phosphoribosyltransferase